MTNGMYYTPQDIIDPATGTGTYLQGAADVIDNPPYGTAQKSWAIRFWEYVKRIAGRG